MAYRSLLVHLDRSPRCAARLAIAFSLAALGLGLGLIALLVTAVVIATRPGEATED